MTIENETFNYLKIRIITIKNRISQYHFKSNNTPHITNYLNNPSSTIHLISEDDVFDPKILSGDQNPLKNGAISEKPTSRVSKNMNFMSTKEEIEKMLVKIH